MAQQGRVQAPAFKNNLRLQPQARPVDTFTAPAAIPQDRNAARLMNALSAFSTSLGGLAPQMAAADAEKAQQEQWAFEKKIEGRTQAEWVADTKAGVIMPHENELQKKALLAASGMNYGAYRANELRNKLVTEFDWDNQDPDKFITDAINSDLEQHGKERNWGAPYLREMAKLKGWAVDYKAKRTAEQFNTAKSEQAFGLIDTKTDEMIAQGMTPEATARAVRSMYSDLGAEGTLGVNYKDLDQEVVNKARRLASTQPEYALALMETQHVSKEGMKLRLADKPALRDIYLNIKTEAVKALDARAEASAREGFASGDLGLMLSGGLDRVEDEDVKLPSGKAITVTRKQRLEAAEKAYKAQSDIAASQGRETPVLRLSRELNDYRKNNLEHPQLKRQVTGIADMATPAALQDTEQRKALLDKVNTAKWLAHESKNTYIAYSEQKDREFVETFLLAKGSMVHKDGRAYSDDEALTFAMETTNPVSAEGQLRIDRAKPKLEARMMDLAATPGRFYGEWKAAPENYSTAYQRVYTLAQRYVAGGMEPEKAVEQAATNVKNTSTVFRGNILMDLAGMNVPEDFEESMGAIVDDFAQRNPLTMEKNGIEASDISIEPVNNPDQKSGGYFKLIDRNDRTPIVDDKGNMVTVSLAGVRAQSARRQAERAAKGDEAIHKAVEADKREQTSRARSEEIRQGKRKGFLEREGIPVPDISGR
ncbi:hypothetical protein [Brucella intermedia]|uniref:hypothetical protein n=1 Tax=Brucella intermedia TaxID=94625 RepID=UPI00235F9D76|nr:hypothetical protein [Brucella intermedia]